MEQFDQEGFVKLIKKTVREATKKEEKPKKERLFKKGSWRDYLFKKLKKWKSPKTIVEFHHTRMENIAIYRMSKPKAIISKRKFKPEDLEKLNEKFRDDCYVLINAGDGIFMRLSLKSYLKIMKIERMVVSRTIKASDDGSEYYEISDDLQVIDNINELCKYVNYVRQLIDGIFEVQSNCCGFTDYKYIFKTVIRYQNDKVKTFKGDFNEVLKELDITPLL